MIPITPCAGLLWEKTGDPSPVTIIAVGAGADYALIVDADAKLHRVEAEALDFFGLAPKHSGQDDIVAGGAL